MNNYCPVCECDPCDCGWGNYCEDEEGNTNRVYISPKSWWDYNGDDFESSLYSTWPFDDDCMEYPNGVYGACGSTRSYLGKVVLKFTIGDPVRYFPNCNLTDDRGIWIIKNVVNKHSLDCSWYDYEITNGSRTTHCRQEEIFNLEV
jgi:hypothetical protein